MVTLPMANKSSEDYPRLKVRLTTTTYSTKRGFTQKKSLYTFAKPDPKHLVRCFEDDIDNSVNCNLEDRIININSCEDGIYELRVCNVSRDYETGYVDDWDWELIKWED